MYNEDKKTNWLVRSVSILFFFMLLITPFVSQAQIPNSRYWIGGSGIWGDGDLWSASFGGVGRAGVPKSGDYVYIDGPGAVVGYNYFYNDEPLGYLRVDGGAKIYDGGFYTLKTVNSDIGFDGTGTFTLGWRDHIVTGSLTLGVNAGGVGTYNLNGSGILSATSTVVGNMGTGFFNQSGGTHTASYNLEVAVGGGTGTYNLTDYLDGTNLFVGVLNTNGTIIGNNGGQGTFSQNGGTHTASYNLEVGGYGGTGTYNLVNGSLNTNSTIVGNMGTGYFNQGMTGDIISGGTHTVNGDLVLGSSWGDGLYTLNAGVLNIDGSSIVGESGQGTFNQYGGTHTANGTLEVGGTGTGTYNLVDGILSTNGTSVGNWGTGTFNQGLDPDTGDITLGGTHAVNGDLILGADGGTSGTYNLSNGDLNVGGWAIIGQNGNGYINQSGGNFALTGGSADLYLGYESDSYGEYNMTGGNLSVGWFYVGGESGEGLFNQSGGTVTLSRSDGQMNVGTQSGSVGTYNLSGDGVLDVSRVTLYVGQAAGSSGAFNQSGGRIIADSMDVGSGGTGILTQTGGTTMVNNVLAIGRETGALGTYTLSGNELVTLTTGETHVGAAGIGTLTQSGGTHTTGTLVLGYNTGGTGTYELNGGSLSSDFQRIGLEGTGTFTQTGGTNTVNDTLVLGQEVGSNGTYTMSADTLVSTLIVSGNSIIGANGIGLFNQSGGTHSAGTGIWIGTFLGTGSGRGTYNLSGGTHNFGDILTLGHSSAGTGHYNLTGTGYLSGDVVIAGNWGNGNFVQDGTGTMVNIGDQLIVGLEPGSIGVYTLMSGRIDGVGLSYTDHYGPGDMFVGVRGQGTFIQQGGDVIFNDAVVVGLESTGVGRYELSNGTLTTNFMQVARDATGDLSRSGGTFIQSGGTVNVSTDLNLGQAAGSTGTYTLSGTGSVNVGRTLYIGVDGTGTFAQSGNDTQVNVLNGGGVVLSSNANGTGVGAYDLDSGTLISGYMTVGSLGYGTFNQTGGTNTTGVLVVGGGYIVGTVARGDGTYTLAGAGSRLETQYAIIGQSGTGSFTQNGGTHTMSRGYFMLGQDVTGNGTYTLNDGTLSTNRAYIGGNGTGTFNQYGGTHTVSGTGHANSGNVTIGSNGIYNMTGGTLNAVNIVNNGSFNAGSDAIINANLQNYGIVSPGSSPGALEINGNYTQSALGTLLIELGGTAQGITYDLLRVYGTASLTGTLDIDLYDRYTPTAGTSFDILIANAIIGIGDAGFQGFTNIIGPNGWIWTVQYLDGSTTDTVRLTANAVPIPGAAWLFLPALAGLIGLRRRFTK